MKINIDGKLGCSSGTKVGFCWSNLDFRAFLREILMVGDDEEIVELEINDTGLTAVLQQKTV
jgi:hypothetical protein